ncbi:sulfite exporter TauE/SafE family protein [Fluviibacterium sp. S390]|uniref:sulfite exporter TauE/SafE family protein n=1 Tax=Fluviibacterium sp. S390 TaxID=3415139 RepID=UPI003C7E2FB4
MQFDLFFLTVASVGVLVAAVSKTGFGGGASFAATPILALVLEPGLALSVMLPLLMLMDVTGLKAYWGKWSLREFRILIAGAMPGIFLAAAVYGFADPDVFRFLIGTIALLFVGFQLAVAQGWVKARTEPLPPRIGLLSGLGAGFTSFVAHAGGPPTLMYLLSQGLPKVMFQATTVAMFSVVNAVKAAVYTGLGMFTLEGMTIVVWLAPVAVLGAVLGVFANRVMPDRLFFGITYVLLTIAGSKLIWDALT